MTQTKAELLQTRHQGDLRLGDADSSHYVGFKSPATVSSSLVWTLPAADGSANQILTTNGSGVLSWSAASSGTTINNNADNRLITGSGTANTLEGEANATYSGSLLNLSGPDNEKLRLTHTSNPRISFEEGTTLKFRFTWNPSGYMELTNLEDSSVLRIKDDLDFSVDGSTFYSILNSNSTLTSSKLSGALPAISGANLTGITTNLVSDTSPQLGGDLDVQTSEIKTATSNRNIKLNPHGSGAVEVKGDGSSNDGTIQLNCSQNSHGIKIKSPPHSASASYTFTFPNDIQNGKFLTTDGSGNTSWATVGGGGTTLNTSSYNLYTSQSGNSNGGNNNISLGNEAGSALGSGATYNTLLGFRAGKVIDTGDQNIAIGAYACAALTSGSYNLGMGYGALDELTTGNRNVSIGPWSTMNNTVTGNDNVSIGNSALRNLTSGSDNVAVGTIAGENLTTASNSTFVGRYAGNDVTTGSYNTFFGAFAGQKITTSEKNTCLGGQAGLQITTGGSNTCIGYNAGYDGTTDLTTGSNNILIGHGVTSSSATVSNEITLGNTSITKFRIPGINFVIKDTTATDNYVLTVDANGEAGWEAAAGGGGGTILNTTSNNLYTSQSGNSNGGTYNISLGKTSGNSLASGSGNNVFLGREAGKGVTTANSNIGIGWYAFANYSTCTGDHNIGMGYATLGYLTSGVYNTAIGNRALLQVTTGNHNNCIGWYAGTDITTSSWNALYGDSAGQNITTGNANTCLGSQTGWNITTGGNNVCVGRDSGARTTTGSYNTFLGFRAGQENSTGSSNTCIGEEAGYGQSGSTNGSTNTFIGKRAGKDITTGYNNVGIGYDTLFKLTSGFHNVCIGDEAANKLTYGSRNIAIGDETMKNQTVTGTYNTYMGYQAGYNQTGSTKNIGIGFQALYSPGSGDNNIAIGEYAMWSNTNVTGNYNIGIGNTYNNLTSGTRNVCIGYQAGSSAGPSGEISTSSDNIVLGNNNIANLYCADTTISSSDSRDKTDVTNFTHGLDWVNKLNPITYRWDKRSWYNEYNEDNNIKTVGTPDGSKKRARQHIGFLAQDVLAIEQADGFASKKDDMLVVNLNEDDSAYGLKYERLVPVLVNAIKELSTEVTTLKTKVATLESA